MVFSTDVYRPLCTLRGLQCWNPDCQHFLDEITMRVCRIHGSWIIPKLDLNWVISYALWYPIANVGELSINSNIKSPGPTECNVL